MDNMKSKFKNIVDLFIDQALENGCDEADIAYDLKVCGFTAYDLETLGHPDIASAFGE